MSTSILSHHDAGSLSAVTLGWLGTSIDRLGEMRAELRRLETAEASLTRAVLTAMRAAGLPALRAEHAIATVGQRTSLIVDPELYMTAVGTPRAFGAMRVLVEKARQDLAAISEATTIPTLRVEPIRLGSRP